MTHARRSTDKVSMEQRKWLKTALKCAMRGVARFRPALQKIDDKKSLFLFRKAGIFLYFCMLENRQLDLLSK
jgi:hypothetical protein